MDKVTLLLVILLLSWIFGIGFSITAGGLIHGLLAIVVIIVTIRGNESFETERKP